MPGQPNAKDFKPNNVYTQKVVVKQANKAQLSDQQDLQKQRLLQSDSSRSPSEFPRNSLQLPPQRLQQLAPSVANSKAQLPYSQPQQHEQQLHTQAQQAQLPPQVQPPQQQQQNTTWQWQPQQPNIYQSTSAQMPGAHTQNGISDGTMQLQRQPSPRPMSAPATQSSLSQAHAQQLSQGLDSGQQQNGSTGALPLRPRTATVTASPRVTNDDPLIASNQGPKSVQWQDTQGNDLCQYREFVPSEQGDSDEDEEQWHSQKKGCCIVM